MSEHVRYEVSAGVARVILDAPERLNAVDPTMLDAVVTHLEAATADPGVRVVALAGAGRAFCSGADLSRAAGSGGELDDATLAGVGAVARALLSCPRPTVALVRGVAAGAGASMALACDYVLAAASATLVLAFARIGLMPDGGATALVAANIGRARALRLALTGEKLPATLAADWGLVSECVPDDEFAARGEELLRQLASFSPPAAAATKAAVNGAVLDLDAALAVEERDQGRLMRSADAREGVTAFLGKRAPVFRGD